MGAENPSTYYKPNRNNAHPAALAILTENFVWDFWDENSPFGNDIGADALAELFDCMQGLAETQNIIEHLYRTLDKWGVSVQSLDLYEEADIPKALRTGDTTLEVSMRDATIIAFAIGQQMFHGGIGTELKNLTEIAITRQSYHCFYKTGISEINGSLSHS